MKKILAFCLMPLVAGVFFFGGTPPQRDEPPISRAIVICDAETGEVLLSEILPEELVDADDEALSDWISR